MESDVLMVAYLVALLVEVKVELMVYGRVSL